MRVSWRTASKIVGCTTQTRRHRWRRCSPDEPDRQRPRQSGPCRTSAAASAPPPLEGAIHDSVHVRFQGPRSNVQGPTSRLTLGAIHDDVYVACPTEPTKPPPSVASAGSVRARLAGGGASFLRLRHLTHKVIVSSVCTPLSSLALATPARQGSHGPKAGEHKGHVVGPINKIWYRQNEEP